jgi:entericidin B
MEAVLRIFVLIAALTALAGCEATKGLGRDVQNAGEALDRAI